MTTGKVRFGTVAGVTSRRRLRAGAGTLMAIDAVVAVVAIAVSWAILSADSINWPAGTRDPDTLTYVLVVAVNAPIAFRRRAWGAALAIALAAEFVYAARQYPPFLAPAVPLIVYLAATRLDDRRSRVVLIVAAVGSWIGATLAAGGTDPQSVLVVAGACGSSATTCGPDGCWSPSCSSERWTWSGNEKNEPGGRSPRNGCASPASCTTSSPTR